MDRAFSSGASGTPPSAPGSPSTGYATSGNPGTATPATKPGAYWYHMVTEELRALIVAAGLTPDHTNTSQIAQAVQAMIAAGAANDYKASVRAATTANIAALAGGAPNTLDGVTLVANDRILVKDQTTGSQNGIYYVSTLGTGANGTWTRATDANGLDELTSGAIVAVEQGSVNADSQWMLTTDGTITIGTTSLTFARKDAGAAVGSGFPTVGATVAANALTVTINAETLSFRSTTLTSGAPVTRSAASQGSLTVPTGATLGMTNAVAARLVWGWLDNAGTLEPFVGNLAGGVNLDETALINTTAMSAGATAANVLYSTTARTGVAFRIRGMCDISQATAGTYATAPTLVQPVGGQALAAMQSLGYGQTWQSFTVGTQRITGTTYYNTTGRPIQVIIQLNQNTDSAVSISLTVNGITIASGGYGRAGAGDNGYDNCSAVIPPGASYVGSGSVQGWFELR